MPKKCTRVQFHLALVLFGCLVLSAWGVDANGQEPSKSDPLKSKGAVSDFADWVVALTFSPDGRTVIAGSYDSIRVVDVDSMAVKNTTDTKAGFATSLAFSPDGKNLAVGCYQSVLLCDKNGTVKKTLKEHRGQVTSVCFSKNGDRLLTGCDDQAVRIWNWRDGKCLQTIKDFDLPVQAARFSNDGQLIAVVTGDADRPTRKGKVHLLKLDGTAAHTLEDHKKATTDVVFTADGHLLSTSTDQTVNVYSVESGKALGFFGGHVRPVNAIDTRNGYGVSVSGGGAKGKNELRIWKIVDGDVLSAFEAHESKVTDVEISPDGKLIATTSEDKSLVFWEAPKVLHKQTEKTDKKAVPKDAPNTTPKYASKTKALKVGIIGLDTSHVIAFTKMLNAEQPEDGLKHCRIIAAYPQGSRDIQSSVVRVPKYTEQVKSMGVDIVESIPELLARVDCVLLETNDGRPHLEQIIPCLKAGKPVFIDKPIAASLSDAIAIFEAAKHFKVPVFSSSSLRFSAGAQKIRSGEFSKVLGADAWSPCSIESTHPDLFWYGIHGVETLFTVMGPGCESVVRSSNETHEVVVGQWKNAGTGTFRGIRKGKTGYGGTVFTEKGVRPIGGYDGYKPLLIKIVEFFNTGVVPVDENETLEIYAFMEAADVSKQADGKPVLLKDVMQKARKEAAAKLKTLGIE